MLKASFLSGLLADATQPATPDPSSFGGWQRILVRRRGKISSQLHSLMSRDDLLLTVSFLRACSRSRLSQQSEFSNVETALHYYFALSLRNVSLPSSSHSPSSLGGANSLVRQRQGSTLEFAAGRASFLPSPSYERSATPATETVTILVERPAEDNWNYRVEQRGNCVSFSVNQLLAGGADFANDSCRRWITRLASRLMYKFLLATTFSNKVC